MKEFIIVFSILILLAIIGIFDLSHTENKKQTIIITGLNKLVDPYKGVCNYSAKTLDNKYVTIDTTCCMFGFDDTITVFKSQIK